MLKRDVERAMADGTTLWTKVGGKRVAVKVTHIRLHSVRGTTRRPTFVVQRVDTGATLPKPRSPQALHCTDGRDGGWPGMTERQDRPVTATVSAELADAFGIVDVPGLIKVTPQVPALDGMAPLGLPVTSGAVNARLTCDDCGKLGAAPLAGIGIICDDCGPQYAEWDREQAIRRRYQS